MKTRRFSPRLKAGNWREAGQSAVLLAIMFMGMLFFVGLATDAGLIYLRLTQLRRAVDAASLGAANELRGASPPPADLENAAKQYIKLQGIDPNTVVVEQCPQTPPYVPSNPDPDICKDPARKLVRVTATIDVQFVFVTMLGWNSLPVTASAIAEAASLEIILVIDVSQSMIWDARPPQGTGVDDDGDGSVDEADDHDYGNAAFGADPLCNQDQYPPDTAVLPNPTFEALFPTGGSTHASTPVDSCRPFEWVRDAAMQFVDQFPQFPFDRVAIVTFSYDATIVQNLTSGTDKATTLTALQNINVDSFGGHTGCPIAGDTSPANGYDDSLDNLWWGLYPAPCTNTNIGRALIEANNALTVARPDALRFVILLSDGETNASATDAVNGNNLGYDALAGSPDYACHNYSVQSPPTGAPQEDTYFFNRVCSDGDARARHPNTDTDDYDADDYARDAAFNLVDQGNTIIFTIGLGNAVTSNPTDTGGSGCTPDLPVGNNADANDGNPDCLPNGEQLLRNIADQGDGTATAFCGRINTYGEPIYPDDTGYYSTTYDATNRSCGTYYYAQGGADLGPIFTQIGDAIFTKIDK